MLTRLKRWLRSRRRPQPIIRFWDADYNLIHTLPKGVKIHMQADNTSIVAYQLGNVDLRRRADDE